MSFISYDKDSERKLRECLAQLQHDEIVLNYHQLQGFLFAIACSPDEIKPSEWFDLIWLTDDPHFDNEVEARRFFKQVVALADHIRELVQQHRYLPFSVNYSERWSSELAYWCDGMLMGHQYLEDVWMLALSDLDSHEMDEAVATSLRLASTFADLETAQQLSFDEGMVLTNEYLPEAYKVFWQVLGHYAHVKHLWVENYPDTDAEQLFLAFEPVARDDRCLCGSGLRFEKCCLH